MSQANALIGRQLGKDASVEFGFKCPKYKTC
jgi:hypothetical protein